MTAREVNAGDGDWGRLGLSPRDADLLADYLGGVLADTPAEADVARLIRDDPTWRQAHEALAVAVATVTADLAEFGDQVEPMPDDVAARLTAALATAHEERTAGPGRDPARGVRPAGGGLSVVPRPGTDTDGAARNRPPGPARRPLTRWAAPLAAAASVVAAVAFGVATLPGGDDSADNASTAGGAADVYARSGEDDQPPAAAPGAEQARVLALPAPPRRLASGTDYRPASIAARQWAVYAQPDSAADASTAAAADGGAPAPEPPGQRVSGFAEKVAGSLRRLMDAAALTDCLNAINREHAHPIAAVSLVDFASFEGSPALLVAFTDVMRENWVWVVGPDCGPASASMRYRAKVG